ncbi:MAG: hypothetical protein QOH81_262 [Sphingomonadales bacterium]|nr:hypothetical protein [Sphingomonadales bacterium]
MEHNRNGFARGAASTGGRASATQADRITDAANDCDTLTLPATAGAHAALVDFDPVALRARADGWTREKQRWFIEELADCGVVREAAARVGMSERSAYSLRRRADAATFNIAWEAALQSGADHLRSVAYERAVHGVIKPHFYHGEKIGEERVFNDRLLLALLARAERTVSHVDARRAVSDWDRWMEAIEDGGAPPPPGGAGLEEPRIWRDFEGHWWTDFRPPPGFAGDRRGDYGDEDYCRICTAAELESIEAMQARREADEHRRRDAWFARMR